MTTAYDTGHGATLGFGTQTFAGKFSKIGALQAEGESVEFYGLDDTTFANYLQGDVKKLSTVDVDFFFNSEEAAAPVVLNPSETITITFPQQAGQSSAANIAGTGFITAATLSPEFGANAMQTGTLTIQFDGGYDGGAAPTFTAGTPSA